MSPTVCILTAGKGTRMGRFADSLNKALLPIDQRAAITHIIEKFPKDTHFVIAIGYLGEQIKAYLTLAHSDRSFSYVDVDRVDGVGSGPGYSLSRCFSFLQKPFYFVSCDTLWKSDFDLDRQSENWIATAPEVGADYCNVKCVGDSVVQIKDKTACPRENHRAFTGLCFIRDFELFWRGMSNKEFVRSEWQISSGLEHLVRVGLKSRSLEWLDIGTESKYIEAKTEFEDFDFSKPNEFIYFVGDQVIKFFADQEITDKRVRRASIKATCFPGPIKAQGQFYSYPKRPGQTLYQFSSSDVFNSFLRWMNDHFWEKIEHNISEFSRASDSFYHQKTIDRLKLVSVEDSEKSILGVRVPAVETLLDRVDWKELSQGVPSFIHGDLQFDNILYDAETDQFTLLDWRQDFGGLVAVGDLYYDFAKLLGGLILNYDLIKQNQFSYSSLGDKVTYSFSSRPEHQHYIRILGDYVATQGMSFRRVRLITALIFLNMSPLHTQPFDRLLHALGQKSLYEALQ